MKKQSKESKMHESKAMKHKDAKQDKVLFGEMMRKEMPKMMKKGCK